jgi:hypothetical protein
MKLTRAAKSGLALIGVGMFIFLGIAIWLKTIRTTIVDLPLPLHGQSARPEFSVDFDGLYTFWIQFDPNTDSATADCLLGRPFSESSQNSDCKNVPPRLEFSWKLSCDGQSIATGSSGVVGSNIKTAKGLMADIVSFHAQKGRRYVLEVELHQDGSVVPIFPPRMLVELDPFNMEDLVWTSAAADSLALLLCLIGAITFSISLLRAKLKNRKPSAPSE